MKHLVHATPGVARLLLWPAIVVVGVGAELASRQDVRHSATDLATGVAITWFGLVTWRLRPHNRSGPLLTLAGFTWFCGNFGAIGVPIVGSLASQFLYLHRAVLAHVLLAYPSARTRRGLVAATVGVGYVTGLLPSLWRSDAWTLALTAGFIAVAVVTHRAAFLRGSRIGLEASLAFAAAVAGGVLLRNLLPLSDAGQVATLTYQVLLVSTAAAVMVGVAAVDSRTAFTDLVVELEGRSSSVRDALAIALDDASLEVGYWDPSSMAYVNSSGVTLVLPSHGDRSVTRIDRDGQPDAVLVHDPSVFQDPGLFEAVAAAARLASSNARLQAAVRAHMEEVRASRLRLLRAADDESQHLGSRMRSGAAGRLAAVGTALEHASSLAVGAGSDDVVGSIERAAQQLARTRNDLFALAQGLLPEELVDGGLTKGLAALTEHSPIPVELSVTRDRFTAELEAAVYFIVSEALQNVSKHAGATCARVDVWRTPTGLMAAIGDDGSGGADPSRGSGLRGLADRMDALGGRFSISSPSGRGTQLTAEFPLGGESAR